VAAKGEVVEVKPNAIALPQDVMAQLREEAKAAAAQERPAVSKASLRSGIITINGQSMQSVECVILFAAHIRMFYSSAFDSDNIRNPDCFSIGGSEEEMDNGPHENAFAPPAESCATCPKNAWKSDVRSDGKVGKGKACKERRRLVLLSSQALGKVDDVKSAELVLMDIPVTSSKNYGNFVNVVNATVGVPPWAVISNISTKPNPKTQFQVDFTPLRVPNDPAIIAALRERVPQAREIALTPYDETSPGNAALSEEQRKREQAAGKKF